MYSVQDNQLMLVGFPHSGIVGSMLVYQLANAFRRLLRPSSPLIAKAFTMCAYSLDHITPSLLGLFRQCCVVLVILSVTYDVCAFVHSFARLALTKNTYVFLNVICLFSLT